MQPRRSTASLNITKDEPRLFLARLFRELKFTVGVEVGTAFGEFAEVLCIENPGLQLYCVDPWNEYEGYNGMKAANLADARKVAEERLQSYGVKLLPMFSMQAVKQFEDDSLDFVYIDANHEMPYIMDDLREWFKKVRYGGVVSGHDYHTMNDKCHVVKAVDEFTAHMKHKPVILADQYHSWYFFKE